MMNLEDAARIACASAEPGCPLLKIVMDHAEGERKARRAEALRAAVVERWGAFGTRGREMEGDPASPSRAHEPSPSVSALRVSPAIAINQGDEQ